MTKPLDLSTVNILVIRTKTPAESVAIQRAFFAEGVKWPYRKKPMFSYTDYPYLYIQMNYKGDYSFGIAAFIDYETIVHDRGDVAIEAVEVLRNYFGIGVTLKDRLIGKWLTFWNSRNISIVRCKYSDFVWNLKKIITQT